MEDLSFFDRIYNWYYGIRPANLKVLRIPADGSPPHLVELNTINTNDNVDCFHEHIPDFRPYWGDKEGFRWRDVVQMEVRDQHRSELNGIYWGWKSFALDLMPISEHTGFCGDAFISKTPLWERDENGAVYEDIPIAFLSSPLLAKALERLHDG